MNGYSDYVREIMTKFYANWLRGSAPANPWAGQDLYVRLSTTACTSVPTNFIEPSTGAQWNPGYEAVKLTAPFFSDQLSGTVGSYMAYLINDVVFNPALDTWNQPINQVCLFRHETATSAEYFIGGFEIPETYLKAGESLTFKSVDPDVRGISVRHVTPNTQQMHGLSAIAQKTDTAVGYPWTGWSEMLNWNDATFPPWAVNLGGTEAPMEKTIINLKNETHIDWLDTSPGSTQIQDWDYAYDLSEMEYATWNGDFYFTNSYAIQFSLATATRAINTIASTGLTGGSTLLVHFGGPVENAPVQVLTGETPVIEARGLMVGNTASDKT